MHALDMPDPRRVHAIPIPQCGVAAMALGVLGPIVFWAQMRPQLSAYLAGGAILFAAGMYDDFKVLGYQENSWPRSGGGGTCPGSLWRGT